MGTRIPIRIYRLDIPKEGFYTIPIIHKNDWNFVLNKTVNDIDFENSSFAAQSIGVILLDPEDVPDEVISGGFSIAVHEVTLEEAKASALPSAYYVRISGEKYFIREKGDVLSSIPNVFEFYVNPERITPTYRKLITETRTRGGWDVQHWGSQLTEIRVEGRTGGLIKGGVYPDTEGRFKSAGVDVTQSVAWKRLNQLKLLYDTDRMVLSRDNGDVIKLGFNYYDRFYIGYFTEFTGPSADAEKPYIMTYSFAFKVEKEDLLDSSMDALTFPDSNIRRV